MIARCSEKAAKPLQRPLGGMADAEDLKSFSSNGVPVRVREGPPDPNFVGGDLGDVSRVGMQASCVERCCLIKIQRLRSPHGDPCRRAKSLNASD